MIVVGDIDNNVGDIVCADRSDAMVLDKFPDLGMAIERRITRPLPYAIFRKNTDDALNVVSVYRIAVDLY